MNEEIRGFSLVFRISQGRPSAPSYRATSHGGQGIVTS